jgi:hypothetical protein
VKEGGCASKCKNGKLTGGEPVKTIMNGLGQT